MAAFLSGTMVLKNAMANVKDFESCPHHIIFDDLEK
jgi:hypothetical protein